MPVGLEARSISITNILSICYRTCFELKTKRLPSMAEQPLCLSDLRFPIPLSSLVSEVEIVHVHGVRRLPGVSVHLVVDGDSPPPGRRGGSIGPIQRVSLAVERDRLIQQLIVRGSLHLDRKMVPRILVGGTGDTRWYPLRLNVVPDVPFIPTTHPTLVSPREAHTVEELVHVELKCLRRTQIGAVEIDIVGKCVQRRDQRVIRIRQSLR